MITKNSSDGTLKTRLYTIFASVVAIVAIFTSACMLPIDDALAFDASFEASNITSNSEASKIEDADIVEPHEEPRSQDNVAKALSIDALSQHIDVVARDAKVQLLVSEALAHDGARYVYGGTTPSGFDCSGFVQYCMRQSLGIELPRTAASQSYCGTNVPLEEVQKGDLVFWGSRSGVYHVGISLGDGSYIHASRSGKGVCVQTMDYYRPSFAKRIL